MCARGWKEMRKKQPRTLWSLLWQTPNPSPKASVEAPLPQGSLLTNPSWPSPLTQELSELSSCDLVTTVIKERTVRVAFQVFPFRRSAQRGSDHACSVHSPTVFSAGAGTQEVLKKYVSSDTDRENHLLGVCSNTFNLCTAYGLLYLHSQTSLCGSLLCSL